MYGLTIMQSQLLQVKWHTDQIERYNGAMRPRLLSLKSKSIAP